MRILVSALLLLIAAAAGGFFFVIPKRVDAGMNKVVPHAPHEVSDAAAALP